MAHSDFSWRKIFSFFGAGLLILVAFVSLAIGGNLCYDGNTFYGVMSILAGAVSASLAVIVYRNYQKWADEQNKNNRPNYTR